MPSNLRSDFQDVEVDVAARQNRVDCTDVSLSASRRGMVRWKCFRSQVVGVDLKNGPYPAHHNAERAGPVMLALFASEKNFLRSCGPFF